MSVLVKPIISEKAGKLATLGKYVFEVQTKANASEIKKEIEKVYKVKVASVNTIRLHGKVRRQGRQVGRTANRKKAVVTLIPGQTIEGLSEPA
ncbi:MAG: 50S ribosomal protein L23 [Candidatus Doudnabacteria bacterium RIFCSPHIGHO2_02_FULL_46_11]|uniref:Large ribosomal subunit protein uL23 n=1 Tax=Candidatus Doudnabacteria bacterium RIFCSPHIGHO2_02_FULL_46_11 TaxID=1817832 RepID=A0A1F5P5H1_9BACT|nr:MAG: 50S ribosomal protein L23 [Candidatus Doudnabacteria bacterium RIFCSPHIGHO2_02_FULL_46_11]